MKSRHRLKKNKHIANSHVKLLSSLNQHKGKSSVKLKKSYDRPYRMNLSTYIVFMMTLFNLFSTIFASDGCPSIAVSDNSFKIDDYIYKLYGLASESMRKVFDIIDDDLKENICGQYSNITDQVFSSYSPIIEIKRLGYLIPITTDCYYDERPITISLYTSFYHRGSDALEQCISSVVMKAINQLFPDTHPEETHPESSSSDQEALSSSQNWMLCAALLSSELCCFLSSVYFINKALISYQNGIKEKENKRYICQLTGKLLREPLVLDDGLSYESEAVIEWQKHHDYCPSDPRKKITCTFFNTNLKSQISEFVNNKPVDENTGLLDNDTNPVMDYLNNHW